MQNKQININEQNNKQNNVRHYPSSVREWNNSIYLYNKNNLNFIPYFSVNANKLIKAYFNLFNKDVENKIRIKNLRLRFRKLSSNRIYLSKAEFKHTNNNVLVNIYLFNRQKHNYLLKLRTVYLKKILSNYKTNVNFTNTLQLINTNGLSQIKKINKDKYLLIKALDIIEKNPKYKMNILKILSLYGIITYRKLLNLTMKKLRLFFYYKQLIYINKSKLNYNYLHLLKKHLETLYNRNVEFNLINLKRFYLNSDILSESVKLKLTKNKNNMRQILNKLRIKIKIYKKRIFLGFNNKAQQKVIKSTYFLRKTIINNLKYRHVTGYRLEAKGRLSKRFTASRSVHKLNYKGNLLNIDSSFRKISCVILKGNLRSNLQYSKVGSKTRIGSYGLKSWVSSN